MSRYSICVAAAATAVLAWALSAGASTVGASTAVDSGGKCVGRVLLFEDGAGDPEQHCANPCGAGCGLVLVDIPGVGDGTVCSCLNGGWDGCCTIAQTAGAPAVVRQCGGLWCPSGGPCSATWRPVSATPWTARWTAGC